MSRVFRLWSKSGSSRPPHCGRPRIPVTREEMSRLFASELGYLPERRFRSD